ncbi:MAG: hypothetical protein PHT07_24885, partial [Paludibacter sp.]|nr:hypothetical protein [Paludibacter sp.]
MEFAGMVPVGTEILARNPAAIAPMAAFGLKMQAEGTVEGLTKRPWEFAGENAFMIAAAHGIGKAGMYGLVASPIKPVRFSLPVEKMWDPTIRDFTYKFSTYRGISFDFKPRLNIIGNRGVGSYYSGKVPAIGSITSPAGKIRFAIGKTSPAKLFKGETIIPGEFDVMGQNIKPIQSVHMLNALEPRITPEAATSVRSIMGARDAASSIYYTPKVMQPYGVTKPSTIGSKAWTKITEYVSKNPNDFGIYGSTVGKAYLGEYGRATLGDFDTLITPKTARVHSENIFKILVKEDFPGSKIIKEINPKKPGEYSLRAIDKSGNPILTFKEEKSVLTGTRYSARQPSGQIVLDLHPHSITGGEWVNIPGTSVQTMGFRQIIWGKSTMGYGKLILPESGKLGTVGFERVKDVVDLTHMARKGAFDLYKPGKFGTLSRPFRAQKGLIFEKAANAFERDVISSGDSEGISLLREARNPLKTWEGTDARFSALKALKESAILDEEGFRLPGATTKFIKTKPFELTGIERGNKKVIDSYSIFTPGKKSGSLFITPQKAISGSIYGNLTGSKYDIISPTTTSYFKSQTPSSFFKSTPSNYNKLYQKVSKYSISKINQGSYLYQNFLPSKYPPTVPPTKYPPTVPPTKYPPTVPPTKYPPTVPPTKYPPTVPPTKYPPTVPPTKYPPTVPPTKYPPTVPPTKYPPTVPPTKYPPTVPPTKYPPTVPPTKYPP